ncbi:MAG: hypothetical protein GF387_02430 [Candidatus Portnoybacteria bacterium]|nr:hypothetical protein [Candidatus Portnoybacteria bacterium]
MQSVYKYTIPVEDYFSLDLPKGAKVLTVQEQHDEPQLWALVEKGVSTEKRNFRLAGTGHPIEEKPETLNYIGTFQLAGGSFIGHVFEIK